MNSMGNRKILFSTACLGMLIFGIAMISLGSVLPAITKKFSMDTLTAGSLASLLPFGILAGSVIFGPLVDRYGYKLLLVFNSAFVGAGLLGIAYSMDIFFIQLSIFFIGFGGGMLNGGTNALVADISSEGKGASLSLLGVFFGVGALGMPVILGVLSSSFTYEAITAGIGYFVLLTIILFSLIKFPAPKQAQGFPIKQSLKIIKDPLLLLFGLILFFESGLEGVVNNWTTSFLINKFEATSEEALYALSLFVLGLTLTRLVLGGLLKKFKDSTILYICILFALLGSIITLAAASYTLAVVGLILLGIGFAAGFPVILGFVGEIYSHLSGTAFSIVLVIALLGNMIINYGMGIIAQQYGIEKISVLLIVLLILMGITLSITINFMNKKNKN
ncbi:MAG: MFS transporter [Ignavibacteriae bacterium]|nr:MFS transporter [Ignavibacteriota bacterium]NOG96674.1 MFS transporter [Ignavibacteriota bacterium]